MTVREEIQITDLEPSIEGGQDVTYVVQIRGIDADGRPGPWSEQFEFTSPEQLPSLESFNYVPGQSGWKLNNDGSFEVNDGTIRGTLQSLNYEPGVSGWTLFDNGNVEFSTGVFRGALQIGTNTFNVDSNGNMFIGGSSLNNAPFAVNTNGQIVAMSISSQFIEAGAITADKIAAKTITADQIQNSAIVGSLIANSAITGSKIANSAITGSKIDNSTITGSKIVNGTIDGLKITDGGVDTVQLAADAVDRFRIKNGEVIREKVAVLAIDSARISDVNVGKLTGNKISGFNIDGLTIEALTFETGGVTISGIGNSISGLSTVSTSRLSATSSGTGALGALRAANAPTVSFSDSTSARFDGNGALRPLSSSKRFKTDISDAPFYKQILNVRPVHYKIISEDTKGLDYGLIAEEVVDLGIPGLVSYDSKGQPRSVNYEIIGLLLVDYVKYLEKRIEELENNYEK